MKGKIYSNKMTDFRDGGPHSRKFADEESTKKPRALVPWNTGERVHRPKKGKGSYKRIKYK